MKERGSKADAVLGALADWERRLREADLSELEAEQLDHLLARAASPENSVDVRMRAAEVLVDAPDACFDRLIEGLRQDTHAYVKRAAERTFETRSARRLTTSRFAAKARATADLLQQIEGRFGRGARQLAQKALDQERESFILRVRHEWAKVGRTVTTALEQIQQEAGKSPVDAAKVVALATEALDAHDLSNKIFDSAQSFTHVPTVKFRAEKVLEVVRQAERLLLDGAASAAPRLRIRVEVDPELSVDMDRGLLVQAFSNVLQNSLEAYPPEGDGEMPIHISARTVGSGTRVEIAFQDWGIGISKASLPYAGQPFRSSKPGTARGLGLANVKKMVESAHGGRVVIDGERGAGTRVTMLLPRRQKSGS